MNIDVGRSILIIAVCAACTFAERLFPFVIFRGREVPEVVRYLGKILPTAIIATLTVYCLRGASFGSLGGFAPSLIAVAVTVALHLWKRNTLISVVGGTACYMLLVQLVFAQKSRVKAEKTKIFFQKASSGFGDVSFKERSGRFKA